MSNVPPDSPPPFGPDRDWTEREALNLIGMMVKSIDDAVNSIRWMLMFFVVLVLVMIAVILWGAVANRLVENSSEREMPTSEIAVALHEVDVRTLA